MLFQNLTNIINVHYDGNAKFFQGRQRNSRNKNIKHWKLIIWLFCHRINIFSPFMGFCKKMTGAGLKTQLRDLVSDL